MTTTQTTLSLRACDAYYAELIDGRYARSLKDLPGPWVPLSTESTYGFGDWLYDLILPSRVDAWRGSHE